LTKPASFDKIRFAVIVNLDYYANLNKKVYSLRI